MDKRRHPKICPGCGIHFLGWKSYSVYCGKGCMSSHTKRQWGITMRDVWEGRVIKQEGCWGWRGVTNPDGYAIMHRPVADGGGSISGHRASWILHFGEIPKGQWVLHKCDNPPCTNPEHLFLGTCKDNVRDCMKKDRRADMRGEKANAHKLTEAQVRIIRASPGGKNTLVLAKQFGVGPGAIQRARNGALWKHVI